MPIAITGVTGHLGSHVLRHLIKLLPPSEIIAIVHKPESAQDPQLIATGVEIRVGDYGQPESLTEALRGADRLFLVSAPTHQVESRVKLHKSAITAAKNAGVKHIIYTSLAFAPTTTARVMQAHLQTEAFLKESGLSYTIIREGLYSESFRLYIGFFSFNDSEVVVPGDGGVSWVTWNDLGEGNAKIIAENKFVNQTILLSGPKAITLKETTQLVSKYLKREIAFVIVTGEEWLKKHAEKGDLSGGWVSTYPALEKGDAAAVDPLLEEILGRPLVSFEDRLKEIIDQEVNKK